MNKPTKTATKKPVSKAKAKAKVTKAPVASNPKIQTTPIEANRTKQAPEIALADLLNTGELTHEQVDVLIAPSVESNETQEVQEVQEEETFFYKNNSPFHHYVNDLGLYFEPKASLDLSGIDRQAFNKSVNLKFSIENQILLKISPEEYEKETKLKKKLGREF